MRTSQVVTFGAAFLGGAESYGALVLNDFSDLTISTDPGSDTVVYYDLETASASLTMTSDSDYQLLARGSFEFENSSEVLLIRPLKADYGVLGGEAGSGWFALNLQSGDVIGGESGENLGDSGRYIPNQTSIFLPGSSFENLNGGESFIAGGESQSSNNFAEGDSGFLGLVKYTFGGEGSFTPETINYGFLEVEVGSLTLRSGGFETASNPTAGVAVTAVPEASSLALLALGVGGLATYRRRELKNR